MSFNVISKIVLKRPALLTNVLAGFALKTHWSIASVISASRTMQIQIGSAGIIVYKIVVCNVNAVQQHIVVALRKMLVLLTALVSQC